MPQRVVSLDAITEHFSSLKNPVVLKIHIHKKTFFYQTNNLFLAMFFVVV